MATLLTLANNILPEIGFPSLSTVVGNTNKTAVQFLAVANREGKSLTKNVDWRILIKRNTITTASSAESYSLPSDFDRFVHNTEWNDSNDEIMRGPMSDQFWQADLSGVTTSDINDRFQIRADGNQNRLWVRPVPTSSENITFFYVSNGWCQSAGGTRQNEWAADDDVILLPEYLYELGLKWRMLQAQRRDFQVELAEYQREFNRQKAQDGGMKTYRLLGPVEDEKAVPHRIQDSDFPSS